MEQTYESPRTRTRRNETRESTQEPVSIFASLRNLVDYLFSPAPAPAPEQTRPQQTQQQQVKQQVYRGYIIIEDSKGLPSGKPSGRSAFLNTVRKGDILIVTDMSPFGLIGHAAIMVTDTYVLEMTGAGEDEGSSAFGSRSSSYGSSSSSPPSSKRNGEGNNCRSSKEDWYDDCRSSSKTCIIIVFRCPDRSIANKAADWAYRYYYDSSLSDEQTIHVKYSLITIPFSQTDPSYCSKLVLQAFHYGTGGKVVLNAVAREAMRTANIVIVPTIIPKYFSEEYKLQRCGWF